MPIKRWRPGAVIFRVVLWAVAGVGVLVVLAGVVWLVWKVPPALYAYVPDPKDRAGAEATTRTGLIAGLAGLAALGSLAVTSRTYRLSLLTYGLSLEGQLTDRYTKAVAQLGDDKLDIRLGGIYALERLAVDSPRDHPTVVEVLSAYLRERTANRATIRVRPPGRPTAHPLRLTRTIEPLAVDIQAALTVLGRLPARPGVSRADLSGANLTQANLIGADLTAANLNNANLAKANLLNATLTDAELGEADLTGALLDSADLNKAWLGGANLTGTNLSHANLTEACLLDADLTGAKLPEADLTKAFFGRADLTGANLSRSNLTKAQLFKANLTKADLSEANLTEAAFLLAILTKAELSGADLTGARGLRQAQLARARGGQSTVLPSRLARPARWSSPRSGSAGSSRDQVGKSPERDR